MWVIVCEVERKNAREREINVWRERGRVCKGKE